MLVGNKEKMALLVVAAIGAILYVSGRARNTTPFPGKLAPTNINTLPPINPQNPALNDVIRPKANWYDPLRIGYTQRWNAKYVKGDYSQEKYLSEETAYRRGGPLKKANTQDLWVQSQGAYIQEPLLMDNNFWYKGVKPHPKIRHSGNPAYSYVPPLTTRPFGPQ